MKRKKFEVRRTPEGTAFEVAFVILAVLVWVYVIVAYNQAPDTIPTHFGPTGALDAFGPKSRMFFPCLLSTVVGACMMVGAYFPHTINLPGVKIVHVRQASLAIRMMRILGLLMLALTAAIVNDMLNGHILLVFMVVIAMVLVCPVFVFLIYKAK